MFVIIAHPRSGTHLLASLLDSHPQINCYDELYLNRKNMPLGKKEPNKLGKNEGFILMYTQFISQAKVDKNFVNFINKAKIIHMTRKDTKKHLDSLFEKRKAEYSSQKARYVKNLIKTCRSNVFDHNFDNVFDITYEEICNNKNINVYENKKLLKFLGVKPAKLTTKFIKGIDP